MTEIKALEELKAALESCRRTEMVEKPFDTYWITVDACNAYIEALEAEIADELNATLGNGECTPHGEWESISQTQEVRHVFCDCGYELGMDERDSWPFQSTRLFAMPNFCPECGRKIRKKVVER